jgi:hypothetical protein
MADFTVTPANVLASSNAKTKTAISGVSIIAGQTLYRDVNGLMKLFDANGVSPANQLAGIALHGSLTGQPISYVTEDPAFTPGITTGLTVGTAVLGSATPGGLCPDADKVSTWFVTEIGRGISTTQIKMQMISVGIAIP